MIFDAASHAKQSKIFVLQRQADDQIKRCSIFAFPCFRQVTGNMYLVVFLARTHRRRECKFIQMAAEADSSLPVDHCGTGICDLRPGRSKTCGTVAGGASVFTDTHTMRKKRQGEGYQTTTSSSVHEGNWWRENEMRDEQCGPSDQRYFSSSCRQKSPLQQG